MVWAYDYYACTYDPDCGVSLSRMLKDVFTPMREGADTHLGHCAKCGVVHLAHDEKIGIIECPVCVLARAGQVRPAALARRQGRDAGVALASAAGRRPGGPRRDRLRCRGVTRRALDAAGG